jgi:hypothetical protein
MYINKNLPIEIVNKILTFRPTHPIAKLFEQDENVKMWKKYFRIRWFFYAFYFNSYYVINSNCRLYDEIFFIEAEKGNYFFRNDCKGKNI